MNWPNDELEYLIYTADQDWCWQFPGWKWVAAKVNGKYNKNRSAASCRNKWYRWVHNQRKKQN